MAEFIDPGKLRTELGLQRCVAQSDGLGGQIENWAEVATVFGMIEPISAQSLVGADQTRQAITHRITMRWRGDVSAGTRLTGQGRTFAIVTSHDPDETGRYLVCRTLEHAR
ncbi:phage head closure protein [Pseudaminobacter soli (ex Li et al. 2025)]|uniref:Phage head-tail adapter protein n=1 Tax=Pseudaminobacter soli (ex Li et al. 2025) TaxID=1295366 RepID=A0A2P7SFT4_9HYPH|nr:phage head closure protein [Mesorhizobium soli]PSJ61343.1 phage head-tail adapter protein [Mesorhizobium soli]